MVDISPETLEFLAGLVRQVNLSASAPDFEQAALRVGQAKREIDDAIAHYNAIQEEKNSSNNPS